MAPAAFADAHGGYTIGVSNTVQGNGWREEMICAMRAQALVEGDVTGLIVAHRNTDSAGQLEDINNLIEAGVDAIVLNPSNPDALNSALEAAMEAGIVVVAVDAGVTAEGAYILSNNQEEYAYLGARWLFEQLGGEGDVVYMRGIAGVSADTDRDNGFRGRWPNSRASRWCTRSSPAGSRTRASSRCSTSWRRAFPSTGSGRRASTT
jgi:ribose transport system substrate-binding protein